MGKTTSTVRVVRRAGECRLQGRPLGESSGHDPPTGPRDGGRAGGSGSRRLECVNEGSQPAESRVLEDRAQRDRARRNRSDIRATSLVASRLWPPTCEEVVLHGLGRDP